MAPPYGASVRGAHLVAEKHRGEHDAVTCLPGAIGDLPVVGQQIETARVVRVVLPKSSATTTGRHAAGG